jgi:hypothetical protein
LHQISDRDIKHDIMKLILVATMRAGSTTLIDAWQINYYKTSDCSGTAKVTQGEGQACLQGPDAYRFLSLVDGSAIMASDDQCQQQGGFEYNRGECNSFLLPYISINGGSGVSADVIYTGVSRLPVQAKQTGSVLILFP